MQLLRGKMPCVYESTLFSMKQEFTPEQGGQIAARQLLTQY